MEERFAVLFRGKPALNFELGLKNNVFKTRIEADKYVQLWVKIHNIYENQEECSIKTIEYHPLIHPKMLDF